MNREHQKKQKFFIKIFALFLFLAPIIFFIYLPTKPIISNLSDLTWKEDPEIFVLNNVIQNGQNGLLTLRSKDGAPAFIPGNWNVTFSPHHVFAFFDQEIKVISTTKIDTIKIDDATVSVKSVQANVNESKIAILKMDEKRTRLCILPMERKSNSECMTLDINKQSEIRWDSTDEQMLYLKTTDGFIYQYNTLNGNMNVLSEKEHPDTFKSIPLLFATSNPSPNRPLFILTALFFPPYSIHSIFHISTKTINAVTLKDNEHILLKEHGAIRILEPNTGRLATLVETSLQDSSAILLPYGIENFSFK